MRGTSVKALLLRLRPGCVCVGLIGGMLLAAGNAALAHHSFSMFEYGSSVELDGTVQEFRFVNPHAFIILRVKGKDGRIETWTLEGQPTPMLEREGWTRATLKPGDQVKMTVAPLRSGGTGGQWTPQETHFRDGKAVAVSR